MDSTVTLYGVSATYSFISPGVYTITLTGKDEAGNEGSSDFQVTVLDITEPQIYAGNIIIVEEGSPVILEGSGFDNVEIVNWTWTFNDGDSPVILYGKSVSYTFDHPGNYTITLTCMDLSGNIAEDRTNVIVQKIESGNDKNGSILLIIIIPICVLIILSLIGLLLTRRKRNASESVEDQTSDIKKIGSIPPSL